MTVADKIRALDAAGCARADIARLLGKRYQHVRNVLEADKVRVLPGVVEEATPFQRPKGASQAPADEYSLYVMPNGAVTLPEDVRTAFNLMRGGKVLARLEDGEFRLISAAKAIHEIQERLRPYWKEGVSWADELIAERRDEVERESRDG